MKLCDQFISDKGITVLVFLYIFSMNFSLVNFYFKNFSGFFSSYHNEFFKKKIWFYFLASSFYSPQCPHPIDMQSGGSQVMSPDLA